MATATEAVTSNTMAITTNNETYRVYVKPDKEGKIDPKETKFVTAGKDGKTWKELDEDSSYTLMLEQTVREYKANSIDGIKSLIPDEEEIVAIFNAGLNAKSDRKIKAELTAITEDGKSLEFDPVELFDSLDLIQEPTQRKNLTPVEKATRQIRAAVKQMFPTLDEAGVENQVRALLHGMQQAGEVASE